jgi:hypothetical protein
LSEDSEWVSIAILSSNCSAAISLFLATQLSSEFIDGIVGKAERLITFILYISRLWGYVLRLYYILLSCDILRPCYCSYTTIRINVLSS